MKKLDDFVLDLFHRVSNWTYRRFGADNYALGSYSIGLALITSLCSAIQATRIDVMSLDLYDVLIFAIITFLIIHSERKIADFFTTQYKLKKMNVDKMYILARFFRWLLVTTYILSLIKGIRWSLELDDLLFAISQMFIFCKPSALKTENVTGDK